MIFSNTEKSILETLLKSKKINEHKIFMRAISFGLSNSATSSALLYHLRQKNNKAVKEFFEAVALDFPENKNKPKAEPKQELKKEIQIQKKEPQSPEQKTNQTLKTPSSKERVKKHRLKKHKNGFKTISFDLDGKTYEKLNKIKLESNMSYSELFTKLIKAYKL